MKNAIIAISILLAAGIFFAGCMESSDQTIRGPKRHRRHREETLLEAAIWDPRLTEDQMEGQADHQAVNALLEHK